MNIAFTLCSNNYLAQAITLAKSIKKTNSNIHFFIGLIDEQCSTINYADVNSVATIVLIKNVFSKSVLENLVSKYNIIELNTSVKPSYFKYFASKFAQATNIFYLDPDIEVYNSFDVLNEKLNTASILLTPHFWQPIPLDNLLPQENLATNYGMYNLGFLGVNIKHPQTTAMLNWWEERCLANCFINEPQGIFVDQLYMNHVPLFFKNVEILKERGCNMAPWNLHERSLKSCEEDNYKLTNNEDLIFYHFSSYQISKPNKISKWYNRVELQSNTILQQLYTNYYNKVVANGYAKYAPIKCVYIVQAKITVTQKIKQQAKQKIKAGVKKMFS